MNSILTKIIGFVNQRFNDIMLFIIIVLLVLLAFSAGYIVKSYQIKQPITITNEQ